MVTWKPSRGEGEEGEGTESEKRAGAAAVRGEGRGDGHVSAKKRESLPSTERERAMLRGSMERRERAWGVEGEGRDRSGHSMPPTCEEEKA